MEKKSIVFGIILGILLFNLNMFMLTTTQSLQEPIPTITFNRVLHEPFIITNDTNFTIFPGAGTPSDPYVIENYDITTSESNAIFVNGTTKNFVIRNCYLESIDSAIDILYAAENTVTLENNICSLSGNGIRIFNSPEVSILNNNCTDNMGFGISIDNSNSSSVEQNFCNNNGDAGINIYESMEVFVSNNTIENNVVKSLIIYNSENCLIQNNSFMYTHKHHVYVSISSFYNTFQYNIFYNTTDWFGVVMVGSNNIFHHNLIQECKGGINTPLFSMNNVIHHNSFVDNEREILEVSQAVDDGENNIWYDTTTNEGNYWSDWSGEGEYEIEGGVNSTDPYPLTDPPIPPIKDAKASFPFITLLPILIILTIVLRKPKKSNIKQ